MFPFDGVAAQDGFAIDVIFLPDPGPPVRAHGSRYIRVCHPDRSAGTETEHRLRSRRLDEIDIFVQFGKVPYTLGGGRFGDVDLKADKRFSLTGCSQMRRRQAVWFIPVESE